MIVLDIKKPIRLRSEKAIKSYLKNTDFYMMFIPYMINYQCLIFFDRIVFSLQSKNEKVFDRYKTNNKVRNIRLEILSLNLPEKTSLIGGFYHKNPDYMACFIKGMIGTSLNFQSEIEYVVYDIGFYSGEPVFQQPFEDRRKILKSIFDGKNLNQVRLLELYKDEEKEVVFQKNKGVFNFYRKDSVFHDVFYRHNNFETFYVVIMQPNMNNRILKSFTIGQFKGGQLEPVGCITNLTHDLTNCDPNLHCGKIALVQSRCYGKKLLNPKLIKILDDEKDFRKCKFGDQTLIHQSRYYF